MRSIGVCSPNQRSESPGEAKAALCKKHAAGDLFTVGSLVLKKNFTRRKRKGGKMDYRWQGPYTITTILGKGLFRLKERDGDKIAYLYGARYMRVHVYCYYHLLHCVLWLIDCQLCEWFPPQEVLSISMTISYCKLILKIIVVGVLLCVPIPIIRLVMRVPALKPPVIM